MSTASTSFVLAFAGPSGNVDALRASDRWPRIHAQAEFGHQHAGDDGRLQQTFRLMACGLGLIVSDLPEWQKLFVKPGHAVACDPEDPGSIARAIAWFVEHPREAAEIRARQKIMDEWN